MVGSIQSTLGGLYCFWIFFILYAHGHASASTFTYTVRYHHYDYLPVVVDLLSSLGELSLKLIFSPSLLRGFIEMFIGLLSCKLIRGFVIYYMRFVVYT